MILMPGREGSLGPETATPPADARLWQGLDRRVPLGVKLIVPLIAVTVLGTVLFGFVLAEQTRLNADAANLNDANATAHAAATFDMVSGNPYALDAELANLVADEPNVLGIWIVDLSASGSPVIASVNTYDIGRTGLIGTQEMAAVRAGVPVNETQTRGGHPVLLTIQAISADNHAVVVITNLQDEWSAVLGAVLWIVAAGLAICLLEVALLLVILEFGVFRRIRRVHHAVRSFGRRGGRERLREGSERAGRDVLFNLARDIDLKLSELDERGRAGRVVTELGMDAMRGADPSELPARALELMRSAAALEQCLLIVKGNPSALLSTEDGGPRKVNERELPVWLTALARTAARSRRPVLAGRLGQQSRYWDGEADPEAATAAFVPMPGQLAANGVMVAMARPGAELSSSTVSLIEAVATALSESLERNEAISARQESEDKSKALMTVSHEIRNPLNAMLGFTELLLNGAAGSLNEKQLKFMQQVDQASHHLLSLVNDYLDLARAGAGTLPIKTQAVAVAPEVKAVLELLGPTAEAKDIVLRSQVLGGAVVQADPVRLRQVLINLVINAIRSTPPRGIVRVEVAGGSNGVRLSIIDTGLGVPVDRQHLVFTEFAELRPGESSDATGLGLALTKRLVEAMGGFVRFTSSEGSGTIFDVWLPGENSPGGADAAAPTEQPLFRS